MLIDFEKAVYYLFRKKKRIDLICEHQHPTASKCCLNHRPAELRSTIQESEREQIKKKKKRQNNLRMKECYCHLEEEVRVAGYQLKRGNFNYHPTLPVIILFTWCAEVTFIHSLF